MMRAGILTVIGITALIAACEFRVKVRSEPNESNRVEAFSAIEQAAENAQIKRTAEVRARSFGINCFDVYPGICNAFVDRLLADSALRAAVQTAQHSNVSILLSAPYRTIERFRIGEGYVVIDPDASSERIISFLVGK